MEPSTFEPLPTELAGPPAPARPRVWTVFLAVPAYLIGIILAAGVLVAVFVAARRPWLQGVPDPETAAAGLLVDPSFFLAAALVQSVLGAALALAAAGLSSEPFRARLALDRTALGIRTLLVASIGLVLSGSIVQELIASLGIPITGSLAQFEQMAQALSSTALVPAALVIGIVAPVAEELFFRGYLQTRLCARWGTWPGILLASLVFALAHLDWFHSPLAFVAGLYLGWLARRAGSIVPAIAVHAVNNLTALVLARALAGVSVPRASHAALLVTCVVGTGAVLWWLAPRLGRKGPGRPGDQNAASLGG